MNIQNFDSILDQNQEKEDTDPNDLNPECTRMIANYYKTKGKKSARIFNSNAVIPNKILYDLLEKVAIKYHDYYYFNYTSYRKLCFFNLFDPFIESIYEAYKIDQKKYLTKRPITYNMVTTILRQICNKNGIKFKIVYSLFKSVKTNDYCIYYDPK